jgi:hypothetical protein
MRSSIEISIVIKWMIMGHSDYGFGSDKNLYNLKTKRKLKQSLNGGSIGYWFGKEFITLHKLKTLILLSA